MIEGGKGIFERINDRRTLWSQNWWKW